MENVYDDGLPVRRDRAAARESAESTKSDAGVAAPRLADLSSPADLRELSVEQLEKVAEEVRDFLVDLAANKGGHFASSLGCVELTLALHHVYETPRDLLVWDVGHQAYAHKLITGRRDRLHTIRQYEGLSGFLKRTESEYDTFGAGHASTAPSAALGMQTAADLKADDRRVVAVIGDGAMTGGLAFEALNNIGSTKRDLLVILNDNAMSISPNVGAVAHYLTAITSHPYYRRMKKDIYGVLERMPKVGESMADFAHRLERGVKGALVPGALFQAMGFHYLGPIDGHDMDELVEVLRHLRARRGEGPVLLHVMTHKGKGYKLAEADPLTWHGVKPFDRTTGEKLASSAKKPATPSFTAAFSRAMCEAAERRSDVVAITAAMPSGTGLDEFKERFPERFFDVGIAEGHGVTFAAGLATQGLRPVCAIYSTFLQRAFDHLIHDCAIQKLPVIFAMDRGGLVGADGPTHHGCFDMAYLRLVPNVVVGVPKDADELADMLETGLEHEGGPFAFRYPRDNSSTDRSRAPRVLPLGSWEHVSGESYEITLLGQGTTLPIAESVAARLREAGHGVSVVNARFVKPLDVDMLRAIAADARLVVTIEEGCRPGGFGSAVFEASEEQGLGLEGRLMVRALPDRFVDHGSRGELLREVGLDEETIASAILERLARQ